jgi:hypothetical protein
MVRPAVAVPAVLLVLVLGSFAAARAQSRAGAVPESVLPSLLEEVRGLRAAMERMASSGARVQLALGRLQMQEQRLDTAIKRLEDTRTRLSQLQRSVTQQQDQLAMIEATLKDRAGQAAAGPPHEGVPSEQEIEGMLKHQRRQIELDSSEIVRLTGEEAALADEVSAEQARWSDLNGRLDEVERSLGR